MFKVLIIDDEPIIRKGIKNIINWSQFDCEVCAEASDGLEGCEMIRKFQPDIIITDIRMPELDGLGMIKRVRDIICDSKTIILTGYRDFDYAQEAIKYGTFEFILKPTKIQELTEVIKRAVRELKFQKERQEEFDKLKRHFEQNIPVLREKLLHDMLYGLISDEEELKGRIELFNLNMDCFFLAMLENEIENSEYKNASQYDMHLYQFGIINIFEDVFSDSFQVSSITLDNKRAAFVVEIPEGFEHYSGMVEEKCAYLQNVIKNCFGFTVSIAVSSEGRGASQLPSKLKECQQALEHKFYMGTDSIIFFKDLSTFFRYDSNSDLQKYHNALLEGIRSGNEHTVKSVLSSIVSCVDDAGFPDREYIKNLYQSTIMSIQDMKMSMTSGSLDKKRHTRLIGQLYSRIEDCNTIMELNDFLEEVALQVAAEINKYNTNSLKLVLQKAIDYLNSHYHEQITLNDVAEHVYVSTCYISRMFKKELGKNFIEYLNELRINKAKELLKDIRYKAYEVAEMVGIQDAHYFSRLFKKVEGGTPTEYREGLKAKKK